MPKKVYEPEFKKKIVQLYLEQGRTIKSLNAGKDPIPGITRLK
ncbi:transposase [Clostridiaceae bacterium]|nr:transposase [Clostridiaceae bacterium]